MHTPPSILILGIGNLLWADEGFGVRAVELLHSRYHFPDHITVLDGGTQGLYLLPAVQAADILIVFDAVDYGLPPGTLTRVYDDEVPQYLCAKKMSLHQTGFQEVLALAQLTGQGPRQLFLVGVQPEELDDYGGSLRASVRAQLEPAIESVLDYLAGFGISPHSRDCAPAPARAALALHRYENERPSAETACRSGDARFLGA